MLTTRLTFINHFSYFSPLIFMDWLDDDDVSISNMFIPDNRDEIYSLISELSLGPDMTSKIRSLLDKLDQRTLSYINIHIFSTAYYCLSRSSMTIGEDFGTHLDHAYNVVKPWCEKEEKNSVKRSILRYCEFILCRTL